MAHKSAKAAAAMAAVLFLGGAALAQCPPVHFITARGNAQVFAKPDVGILILTIQSSAPLAADALRQNARTVSEAQAALTALGFSAHSYKISPVVFTRAGGGYGPNQPSVTGIQAEQFVYVFFGSEQLKNPGELGQKIASTIDALTKAGASPANPYPQQPSAMVVYTVKDPLPYENHALQEALDRARSAARSIATQMGVQITGLHNVSTSFSRGGFGGGVVGGLIGPYPQAAQNALAELPYRFYSIRADQVAVTADASVNYNFK